MKILHYALQGPSGQGLVARIVAFALHAKGVNPREARNAIGDVINFDRSMPMLAAFEPDDDRKSAFNLVQNDEFEFGMEVKGKRWRLQRTTRSLAFFALHLRGEEITIAAEIGESAGEQLEPSLKRVAIISKTEALNIFTKLHRNVHLRAVTVKGTGRVGIILPKYLGWKVLPIPELCFGASASIWPYEDQGKSIALDRFIGEMESTGGDQGNRGV